MSRKRKSGLQRGLSEIVARQTAAAGEKARQSAHLISRFAEPKPVAPAGPPVKAVPRGRAVTPVAPLVEKPVADEAPQALPSPELGELVREERGYYPTFNDISDRLVPELKLDAYEQAVVYRMYRLSRGWQKDSCVIGHTKLADSTNLSRSTVQKTVARLIERGLIENLGNRGNDGTEYRVLPGVPIPSRGIPLDGIPRDGIPSIPSRGIPSELGIPSRGHIKNIRSKNNNKKGVPRLTPEEVRSLTATVVGLLVAGQSVGEVEARFAPTMHAVDWATVRSTAQAQVAPKKGK
ncbi:MAG TPA: replication protein [Pyrinomonadaceae bacterium]